MKLEARPVTSLVHLEQMRVIRNASREFMTRDQREISVAEQIAWWNALDHESWKCFVFVVGYDEPGDPVGYGITRSYQDGSYSVTGALLSEYRGKGLGRQLFQFLVKQAWGGKCWLEVLETNVRAQKLYESLGFRETKRENGIITMIEDA